MSDALYAKVTGVKVLAGEKQDEKSLSVTPRIPAGPAEMEFWGQAFGSYVTADALRECGKRPKEDPNQGKLDIRVEVPERIRGRKRG